jgi:hypothetical protein
MNFFFDLLKHKITSLSSSTANITVFTVSDRRLKFFWVGASIIPPDYYQNFKPFCFDLVFGKNRFNVENKYDFEESC